MTPDLNRIIDGLIKALPWYACDEDGTERQSEYEPADIGHRFISVGLSVVIGHRDLAAEGVDWRETKCRMG